MDKLKIYMAPMQGYTEAPFRNAFSKWMGGVDVYFTPFVRWEHGGVRRKDLRDTAVDANRVDRMVPQLIAATREEAENVLGVLGEQGYKEVDLNLGCCFPALAKRHKGSGILPYPEEVKALLALVDAHPEIRFSVKMRLGYERSEECLALTDILNSVPLQHVAVHARVGRQQYKGDCDTEMFMRLAERLQHPVIYNGDILLAEDIEAWQQRVPTLQGVMVGRGLLVHPWMAAEYKSGKAWTDAARGEAMRHLHADLLDHYEQHLEGGEIQLLTKMKSFWEYLLADADRKLLKKIHKAQRIPAYTEAVNQLLFNL
ncbi:MAG: tRNA-dihydrouridine synthase family protein [Clostridium sp.]|nr:tRNA-dihydrouridine synthase family protein [Clostridium sp.]